MASFTPFKFTSKGLDLEYKVQAGKVLRFSKFMLGDGYNTDSIRDLNNLINVVREEPITRMQITGSGDKKKIVLGFDLDTTKLTTGFYLREIGIMAIDPDTQEEILMFYTNAGETADYIANDTSSTVTTKLINAEIYITDVEEITATIDSSLVYVSRNDLTALREELISIIGEIEVPTKTSDLEKDDVYTKEEVNQSLNEITNTLNNLDYNDLANKPVIKVGNVSINDGTNLDLEPGLYNINSLTVNGVTDSNYVRSFCNIIDMSPSNTETTSYGKFIILISSYNFVNKNKFLTLDCYKFINNTWSHVYTNVKNSQTDLEAGVSELATGSIYFVYE